MKKKKEIKKSNPIEVIKDSVESDGKDYQEVSTSQFAMKVHSPQQTNILEATELGDVMKYMHEDKLEDDKSMTTIDMKSRLGMIEISGMVCVDFLIGSSFLPQHCIALTRTKKRLNVSLRGLGRQEMVAVVVGKREQDAKANPMNLPK
jgi:hypothetical protein